MILVTRLGGSPFALNPDMIEKAEETPDTVVTMVNGQRLVIRESLIELVTLMRDHRARVLVAAHDIEQVRESEPITVPATGERAPVLRVVTKDG